MLRRLVNIYGRLGVAFKFRTNQF